MVASNRAMDTDYLQCTVGEALAQGLAEVAIKKPVDPIEYLGSWLLRYKANTESASAAKTESDQLLIALENVDRQEEQSRLLADEETALVSAARESADVEEEKEVAADQFDEIKPDKETLSKETNEVTSSKETNGVTEPATEKLSTIPKSDVVAQSAPITDEEKAAIAATAAAAVESTNADTHNNTEDQDKDEDQTASVTTAEVGKDVE